MGRADPSVAKANIYDDLMMYGLKARTLQGRPPLWFLELLCPDGIAGVHQLVGRMQSWANKKPARVSLGGL